MFKSNITPYYILPPLWNIIAAEQIAYNNEGKADTGILMLS